MGILRGDVEGREWSTGNGDEGCRVGQRGALCSPTGIIYNQTVPAPFFRVSQGKSTRWAIRKRVLGKRRIHGVERSQTEGVAGYGVLVDCGIRRE